MVLPLPLQPEPSVVYVQLPLPLSSGIHEGSAAQRDLERGLAKVLNALIYIYREQMREARFSVWTLNGKVTKVTGIQRLYDQEF
jgi:hypothetical protein